MNAPSTPPHQPDPHDPWRAPPSGPHLAPGALAAPTVAERRAELVQGAVTALLLTVVGIGLGLLWLWLAPRVPLVSDDTAVYLKDSEGEEAIGADGTFVLLALGFGLLSAAAVFLLRRRGGIPLVVGLALGGLLGSLVAWRVGTWLGPTSDVVAHAKEVGKGVVFDAPLELRAVGAAILAWPIAAMIVHLLLTWVFGPRDPEPDWGAFWGAGPAQGSGGLPESEDVPGPGAGDGSGGGWPRKS
ncbi:ABC transporter permease [Streptomyces sp. NBC_01754]|uniref:ABC transporter permease n=1 Tax=Streptomyces sp. NBC_01754 TaxID=2975930 RepID=UPI002DD7AFB4|nr:ABC transporter permease [Streptomyces sp. NBC_01754]WSC92001.1 ABC transporter permease [Streptomyces sp. NBC_01754]